MSGSCPRARGGTAWNRQRAGSSGAGRVKPVPAPLAAQSPRAHRAPGAGAAAAATCRGCADARAPGSAAGALSLAAAAVRERTCPEPRSRPAALPPAAAPPREPRRPPWCRGSSPDSWCKWPPSPRPFVPFFSAPGPGCVRPPALRLLIPGGR